MSTTPVKDAAKIADFIIFSQREFLLGLSKDLGHMNISFCQFYFLCLLTVKANFTMSSIARKIGFTTNAACGFVDHLEKFGFVRRKHDLIDRRSILVNITEKGRIFVADQRAKIRARVAKAMDNGNNALDGFLNDCGH